MANPELRQYILERLRALSPTLDLSTGSPAFTHVIDPLLARLGGHFAGCVEFDASLCLGALPSRPDLLQRFQRLGEHLEVGCAPEHDPYLAGRPVAAGEDRPGVDTSAGLDVQPADAVPRAGTARVAIP